MTDDRATAIENVNTVLHAAPLGARATVRPVGVSPCSPWDYQPAGLAGWALGAARCGAADGRRALIRPPIGTLLVLAGQGVDRAAFTPGRGLCSHGPRLLAGMREIRR